MAPQLTKLLFIPGLHKFTAAPGPRPVQPTPSPKAYCPSTSRHPLVTLPTPSLSGSSRRANPPRGRRAAPQALVAPPPSSSAGRSILHPSPPQFSPSTTSTPPAESSRSLGHKHTPESKRKISAANRGNVPWNKGRRHTEETKRKISEATKRAMLQPEMRRLLKERAKGRKHSEATKLKIRETARASRGSSSTARKPKKQPVPFTFPPEVVADLNDKVQHQLETSYKLGDSERLMVREKRPMPDETKAKLSASIKKLWSDPDYRTKVAEGIEQRAQRLGKPSSDSQSDTDRSPSRAATRIKREFSAAVRSQSPRRRLRGRGATLQLDISDDNDIVYNDDNAAEVFLDPASLDGITREDLGLHVPQEEGKVETGPGARHYTVNDREIDDIRSRLVPDSAMYDHHDLLTSLARASRSQHLSEPVYGEMTDVHPSFEEMDFTPSHIDPLGRPESGNTAPEYPRDGPQPSYRGEWSRSDGDRFFDESSGEFASPGHHESLFVPLGSAADDHSVPGSSDVNAEFQFQSGGEHIIGQTSGSGDGAEQLPLHYVDDNFEGLDIYDDGSTSLENALKSGQISDFGRHSGQFAKNQGKGK